MGIVTVRDAADRMAEDLDRWLGNMLLKDLMMSGAKQWIDGLQLRRHPEGGYFRETYRSEEAIAAAGLPPRFGGARAFSTAIYFLLDGEDFSALYRIQQDEIWHFYDGATVMIHVIGPAGNCSTILLGNNRQAGAVPQAVVKAGCYFGASVSNHRSYALVGCTVAPGFDFADFEMPGREELYRLYPRHRQIIARLTR